MTVQFPSTLTMLTPRALLLGGGNADALENVNPGELPNGCVVWVVDQSRFHYLDKTSTAAVSAPTIIATVLGAGVPGRWVQVATGGGGSPTGAAGGQLSGTYPNPSVAGITETSGPTALTVGAISNGQVLQRSGATVIGVAATFPPNGAAGGQLSGTYPNPAVAGITETSGPTALTVGAISNGQVLQRSGATVIGVAATFPPSGAAGGDLSGTYPNPAVAAITTTSGATQLTIGAITNGQVLQRSGGTIIGVTASFPPSGAAGGDLSGTYPNPAVAAITTTSGPTQLTIGAITNGQILQRSATTIIGVTAVPVANGGTGLTALGTTLQVLRTNAGVSALEYATPGLTPGITEAGTTRTIALADQNFIIYTTSNSPVAIHIPEHATVALELGLTITVVQLGTGQVTFVPDGVVTILSTETLKTRNRYAFITATQRANNEWYCSGERELLPRKEPPVGFPSFLGPMGATQYPSQYTTVGSSFIYSFLGRQTGLLNTGRMWIPTGYDPTDWNTGWPTCYGLHGKGGTSLTTSLLVLPRLIDAITALQIRPCLFIMPDAGNDWYSNAYTGTAPGETKIMGDLIPQVDEHTHSQGDVGRIITGFSMGGFGCLRLATKYSSRFRGVCAYANVNCDVDLANNFTTSDAADYAAIWNSDINLLRPDAPAASVSNLGLIEVNAAILNAYPPSGYPIRLVRSTADAVSFTMAGNYGAAVTAAGVAFTGIVNLVTPTHNVGQYYTTDAGNGFAFLEAALAA